MASKWASKWARDVDIDLCLNLDEEARSDLAAALDAARQEGAREERAQWQRALARFAPSWSLPGEDEA